MKKKHILGSTVPLTAFILISLCLLLFLQGCGGGSSDCAGSTFVNQSTQNVTVSANALSGISFSTFTLESGESNKVCGNDTDDIMADVEWADGETNSKGGTWSGWDGYFCITSAYQILTGQTEDECS